jgi:hypothetical protein
MANNNQRSNQAQRAAEIMIGFEAAVRGGRIPEEVAEQLGPLLRGNYQAWELVDAGARMIVQIANIPQSAPTRPLQAQLVELVEMSREWQTVAARTVSDQAA